MEEIRYRQDKKKYKDENLRFADEGKRYKPRERKRASRVFALACIAAVAAAIAVITVFVSRPAQSAALADSVRGMLAAASTAAESMPASAVSEIPSAAPALPAAAPAASGSAQAIELNLAPPAAAPLVYESGDKVFLAGGANSVALGDQSALYGCYESINAMLSGDNRWLYYISGLDSASGTGTLMKAPADASSEPVAVAQGVCAARASYDGSRAMYFKDMQGVSGSLYVLSGGGEELIAKNAVPDFFEFSPGGACISYITDEGGGTFTLYIKKEGEAPVFVTYITAEAVPDNGAKLSGLGEAMPFDNGDILYSVEEDYTTPLYLFTGGSLKTICDNGYLLKTYAAGDFLYGGKGLETKPLWYKAPGAEPVLISENYDYIVFPDGAADSSGFLLVERLGEGSAGVMMYVISKDKIDSTISLAESEAVAINKNLGCVAYLRDNKLYASRKTDGGWVETFLSDASTQSFQGSAESGMHVQFDGTGANLYFADEFKTGPLYRFSVQDGSLSKLKARVDWFRVAGDTPFAHTTDDKLYCIGNGAMIRRGVREIMAAEGGAYALTGGDVMFIDGAAGRARKIGDFTNSVELPGTISYTPPLGEDADRALGVLAREADYCLYKLGYFRDKCEQPLGTEGAAALTGKLLARQDLSDDMRLVIEQMDGGFKAYGAWANGSGERKAAGRALEDALTQYDNYIESGGSGEED